MSGSVWLEQQLVSIVAASPLSGEYAVTKVNNMTHSREGSTKFCVFMSMQPNFFDLALFNL